MILNQKTLLDYKTASRSFYFSTEMNPKKKKKILRSSWDGIMHTTCEEMISFLGLQVSKWHSEELSSFEAEYLNSCMGYESHWLGKLIIWFCIVVSSLPCLTQLSATSHTASHKKLIINVPSFYFLLTLLLLLLLISCCVAPAAFNVTAQVVFPSATQEYINVTWTVSYTVMLSTK